ncbi:MAG: hypothetical protein N3D18_13940 [Roseococcus sp.]|nr:hypothetical protein [Roseococcus sp.]
MPRPAPPDLEILATLAAIDSMQGTLALARALVEAGRRVELAGLEQEAERLCAAIACLPEGAGARLRAPLHGLTQEIDRLSATLRAA